MSQSGQQLRVAVTDDEAPARSRLRDLLEDISGTLPLEIVGEAQNGRELRDLLVEQPADVVLLDIRMPEMDGIEVAQHLQRLEEPPHVIFTTAYDDYALKAFELHAIDYLVKPIRLRRRHDALARVRTLTRLSLDVLHTIAPEPRTHLSVLERGKITLVPVEEILYLRAELKYVTVRTAAREHLIEESLARLEQEFGERFVRVHRNCLVARDAIRGFERRVSADGDAHWEVLLRGVTEALPVSRRQQFIVREIGRESSA